MKYRAIIFDLDGTLTDTLEDLRNSTNYALQQMGWPQRTLGEVRMFVGNGVRNLMLRAVPQKNQTPDFSRLPSLDDISCTEEEFEQCFGLFKKHYLLHCQDNTCLYDGISELLTELKNRGYLMAVVSNKLQSGVDELADKYFKGTIDIAIGERTGLPRKPNADMVNLALEELGATKEESVYIGDSDVDILTAHNSNLPCISVLWGFRDKDFLIRHGATTFASTPLDILELV